MTFDQSFLNLSDQAKLRDYLAKAPRDPSATSASSSDTYKIGGTSIGYQVAAALEVVGESSKLGAYDTSRVNAVTVGNFVPTGGLIEIDETNGDVTASGAITDIRTLGLIASGTYPTALTAAADAATIDTVVIDGSSNLPY